jgi:dipeptidase
MCYTFLALAPATADGSVIFGKNSDREPNEAQILEYHPGRVHALPADIACTYVKIPQVKETYATLLSRPFWMWGAEMGANEKGVVIGNQAVWTRMPLVKSNGLTGMDMLRLALERSANADQALETIVQLLTDYGQGGICGYQDKRMTYHNSYIIADPHVGWIVETAGPFWTALKIKEYLNPSGLIKTPYRILVLHRTGITIPNRCGGYMKNCTGRYYWIFRPGYRYSKKNAMKSKRSGS